MIQLPKLPHRLEEDDFGDDCEDAFDGPKPLGDWIYDWFIGYGASHVCQMQMLAIEECKQFITSATLNEDDWLDIQIVESHLSPSEKLLVWRKIVGLELVAM